MNHGLQSMKQFASTKIYIDQYYTTDNQFGFKAGYSTKIYIDQYYNQP